MPGRTAKKPADKPPATVGFPPEALAKIRQRIACTITPKLVAGPAAAQEIGARFAAGKPYLEFLCTAPGVPL